MNLAGLLVFAAIAGVSYGISFSHQCGKNAGNYTFTLQLDLEGGPFISMTFKDYPAGNELTSTCSTDNGQITGSGNSTDPYTITIEVDPVADINLGSPDCGHLVVGGNVLNWTAYVVQTLPPPLIPGANGLTVEQEFTCDYDTVTENPTVNLTVDFTNITLDNITTTIVLVQLSRNVRMLLTDTLYAELPGPYVAGSPAHLALEVDGGAGVYGYNCIACNTAVCDDLTFPILDADGCKEQMFLQLLTSPAGAVGTIMIDGFPFLCPLSPQCPNVIGRAFTEPFFLFRFVRTTDVYFRCNVGYCSSSADPNCQDHCPFATSGRKKREAPTVDPDADRMTVVFSFEATNAKFVIDYPDDDPNATPTIYTVDPPVESCMEKPGFVAVLALLGTAALASVIVALGFGLKLSSESGKICGYW